MTQHVSRRAFLRHTAAGAAGLVNRKDARSARAYPSNGRLAMALVRCGGRGSWFVDTVPRLERLVMLRDVNEQFAAESFRKLPDVPKHADYRRTLEDNGEGIDAVIIAVPDHFHAPCSLFALRHGKHVFCEKPLTHDIRERIHRESAAKRAGPAQGHQQDGRPRGPSEGPSARGVKRLLRGRAGRAC